MKKISKVILFLLTICVIIVTASVGVSAEQSLVEGAGDETYTVIIPEYIETASKDATPDKQSVTVKDVAILPDNELTVSVQYSGSLTHKNDSDVVLSYDMYSDKAGAQAILADNNTVLKVGAKDVAGDTSQVYAQLAGDALYAGVYTDTVVFNIKVAEKVYTPEEIEADDHLFGIGKTKSEYVIARFNDDFTEVTIFKNGDDSDGMMKDFSAPTSENSDNLSPFAQYKESLINVVVNTGVTTIGYDAFYQCSKLKDVYLPDSITEIGICAFSHCQSLKDVHLPDSITKIDWGAFQYCQSLTDVKLPAHLTTIDNRLFNDCSMLERVEVGSEVSEVDAYAFLNCHLLNYINLPDGVERIGVRAFYDCGEIENIHLSDSLKTIENDAFFQCSKLKNIYLSDTIESIGDAAFEGCKSLTDVKLPAHLTTINFNLFQGCSMLERVEIGDEVVKIDIQAFSGCTSLNYINLPDGLQSIGNTAFSGCKALESILIPKSVNKIGLQCFLHCQSLRSIEIPNGVTAINDRTFQYCYSLQEVIVPESVTSIGNNAFAYCSSLSHFYIHENITSIGESAFRDNKLVDFEVADDNSVYCTDEYGVLYSKDMETLISFPNALDIDYYEIPESVTTISSHCFGDWTKDLYIGANVINIDKYAFSTSNNFYIRNLCFHTPSGSAMEAFCIEHKYLYDNVMMS